MGLTLANIYCRLLYFRTALDNTGVKNNYHCDIYDFTSNNGTGHENKIQENMM